MKPNPSLFLLLTSFVALFVACGRDEPPPFPTQTPEFVERTVEPTALPGATPTALPTQTFTPAPTSTPTATPTPFITPPAAGENVVIPILMYHHLKYREANASQVLRTWSVAPNEFAAQLDFFQARGFHTITFKQLVEFFEDGAPLPTKPLLLTFDDGWIDSYTVAFPELKKRGMVGNFFVPTQYLDVGGELLINWEQAIEMDRAGMEFGGHTISHEDLTKITLEQMRRQLSGAKEKMEAKFGHPTYALSYPFGAFNPRVVAATQTAGYRAALILCCGYKIHADDLLTLPRIRISYDDTLEDIAKKLP